MNKTVLGIIIGLLFSMSVVYFIESVEELSESEYDEGAFFLVTGMSHLILIFLLSRNNKKIYHYIVLVGTVSLVILYSVTRSDLSSIGELGMVSKIIQAFIIIGSISVLREK